MNHFNESFYAHPHHLSQPASTLLLTPSQRFFAAKLAAVMTNGSASSSSSPSSTTNGTSQVKCTESLVSNHSNSILYSAISAAASTFAIPQPPPPLISISGPTSTTYYQARSSALATNSNSPSLLTRQLVLPPSGSMAHQSNGTAMGAATGRRQQAPSEVRHPTAPPTVVLLDSDGIVSTTTTISSTTNGTTPSGGGGRGRGLRGRPPNSTNQAQASGRGRRPYTHRSGQAYGRGGIGLSGGNSIPPSAPQVASVAAAHQNESHNSLAASMPLLSSYLRNGTINGYQNGHNMGHRTGVNMATTNSTNHNQQPKNTSSASNQLKQPSAIINSRSIEAIIQSLPIAQSDLSSDDDDAESVRFGRVPKREKAKILAAMQKVNAHSLDKAMSVVLEDEHNISATIAKAHEETCDYTREKVAPLLEAARSRPIYAQCPPQMTCPLNPIPVGTMDVASQTARILEDFSERFSPAIRGVVEFAKRIPGFSMLSQEDQVTLLKAGVFEVLLVRLACMFDSANGSMVCLNGLVLRRDALHSASNARFLLDSMFDFADRLNSLRLSDHEVGLFCAVVVIAPDRPGIRNIDLVQKINKRLEEVLQKTIASNHPNDVASGNLIFSELTKKIPDLRTLNTLHSEKLLGKSFGVNLGGEQLQQPTVATSTSVLLFGQHSPAPSLIHPPHSPMDTTTSSTSSLVQCPMQSAAASLIVAQHQQSQQQHQQPDSSDNSPSDRWSSSSSLGHFSPATSTEDGRSVSPSSGPWNEHHSKDGGFGSPRSSSSGVSSDDSHSRKGSISLPSAPPKLAYINSYVRGMSSPLVVSSEHHAGMPVSSVEDSYHHHQVHHLHPYSSANGSAVTKSHRRVDSPTDSGIDHLGSSTTPTTSVCSSPTRSAIEEATKKLVIASSPRSHVDHTASDSEGSEKQESIDDMPVLKRALQAPPLVNTNKLMDEAYRHHKKFRAAARRDTDPHSPSTTTGLSASQQQSVQSGLPRLSESSSALSNSISSSSLASTHSTLLKTLEQPSRYLSEQQLKRTDLIHNIIMSTEAVQAPGLSAPVISMHQAAASAQASPQSAYQAQLFSSTSSPNSSISPKAKENITVMYPQGYYHHIPVASTPNAGVCPYTGRSASSSGASSTGPVSTSPALHQFPLLSQHYAKSPEPGVAAAAAGLLVIGSSIPAAAPSPASVRSLSPMHQAPSPYSHLQRCLTATTAPIGLHGPSLLPPATAATNDLDDEDAQPLNLSKKASPSPLPVSYSPGPLVIATGSVSPAPSSIKMEAD